MLWLMAVAAAIGFGAGFAAGRRRAPRFAFEARLAPTAVEPLAPTAVEPLAPTAVEPPKPNARFHVRVLMPNGKQRGVFFGAGGAIARQCYEREKLAPGEICEFWDGMERRGWRS